MLDDHPSLDGWDLVYARDRETVWLQADDILYVTRHTEAAMELCAQVCANAPMIILKGLAAVCGHNGPIANASHLNGLIARSIVSEMLEDKGQKSPRQVYSA